MAFRNLQVLYTPPLAGQPKAVTWLASIEIGDFVSEQKVLLQEDTETAYNADARAALAAASPTDGEAIAAAVLIDIARVEQELTAHVEASSRNPFGGS